MKKKDTPLGIGMCSDSYTMPNARRRQAACSQPCLVGAWLVHAYTATGAVARVRRRLGGLRTATYRLALALMFVATVVDATDGVLARRGPRQGASCPAFDGARLDDIVDYLTFVFLPMLLLSRPGALPAGWRCR